MEIFKLKINYKDKFIEDFSKRLIDYEEKQVEPLNQVKQYFVDSGNFLLFLYENYEDHPNRESILNWLYHLGSLFGQTISNYYFGYLLNQRTINDYYNCNSLISQMLITFKVMELYRIPSDKSILKTFFERVERYVYKLGTDFLDPSLGSLIIYGYCIALDVFSYFIGNSSTPKKYLLVSKKCFRLAEKRLSLFLTNYNVKTSIPDAIALWIFILNLSKKFEKIKDALNIKNQDLREDILKNLNKLTKLQNFAYPLLSSIEDNELFLEIQKLTKNSLLAFSYTGSYWNNIPRYAMCEFYSSIYGNVLLENKYISEFRAFAFDYPISTLDMLIEKTIDIQNQIEYNSAMTKLIQEKKYEEKDFRDYFMDLFYSGKWISDRERESFKKTLCDLRVSIPDSMFRISYEFKIWKRNFKINPPIEELIDNMGNNDKVGIIYMVNENKKPIEEKYKKELIDDHHWSIPGTYEEKEIKNSTKKIYISKYKNPDERIVEIYHFIYDLYHFWE